MRTLTTRVAGLVAGAALALGLALPAAADTDDAVIVDIEPAASAQSPHFDATGLSAKDVVVGPDEDGCRYVTVALESEIGEGVESWHARVDVARGSRLVTWVAFYSDRNPDEKRLQYCPSDGLGEFTLGSTEWWVDYPSSFRSGVDTTKGSFYARAEAKASISSITRSGEYATVRATATRFKPYAEPEHVTFSADKAVLQVKGDKGWKSVETSKLVNGSASFTHKSGAGQTYRVLIPETDTTTEAVSGSARK
ncbi:hypothetical protein GCM10022219_22160 [Microbacterium oryzae]|uniref:Calcium-binding protein n=1 Tax=Microbacterium oryzae TaxID=743009 RepID=A0A6I6DTW9_9MICO|nr:hypothetical protein [Microbacterium oryzae]QGU27556.1 hypothetical protein D7D94_07675 [Microbacterium oryzae]